MRRNHRDPHTPPKPRYPMPVKLAAGAALAVAAASFLRSFTALSDLAMMFEVPADQAWTLPIGIDGLVIVATVAAVMLRGWRWYSWMLLIVGTLLSVAGNGIHAWLITENPIGVGIAVIPPLVTLAAIHLTVVLAHENRPQQAAAPLPQPPMREPEPVTEPAPLVTDTDLRIPDEWLDDQGVQRPVSEDMTVQLPVVDPHAAEESAVGQGPVGVVIDADDDPEGAREWALEQMRLGTMNYVEIAQGVNRSEGTIRRWRDAAGIPPRLTVAA